MHEIENMNNYTTKERKKKKKKEETEMLCSTQNRNGSKEIKEW
jgi:hypothetical protein